MLKIHAKSFQHPKTGRFQEADRSACEYLSEKRNEEMPLTGADIQLKALEITKELNIPTTEFKVCNRLMRRNGLCLRCETSCPELPLRLQREATDSDRKMILFEMLKWN